MKIFNRFNLKKSPPTFEDNEDQIISYLSHEIFKAIEDSTLTGSEIAKRLNMAKTDFNDRIMGRTGITIGFLISLAYVLGKTVRIDLLPIRSKLPLRYKL